MSTEEKKKRKIFDFSLLRRVFKYAAPYKSRLYFSIALSILLACGFVALAGVGGWYYWTGVEIQGENDARTILVDKAKETIGLGQTPATQAAKSNQPLDREKAFDALGVSERRRVWRMEA